MILHFSLWPLWMLDVPVRPHNASNPSGSLAPGESQAQRGPAGLLPRGCVAAVWSPSRNHIKGSIQRSPRLWTARSSDWHRDIKPAFCWSLVSVRCWNAVLEYYCKKKRTDRICRKPPKTKPREKYMFLFYYFILIFNNTETQSFSRTGGDPLRGRPTGAVTFY